MEILHVKNMVCNRCISAVLDELDKLGIIAQNVRLGEIVLDEALEDKQKEALGKRLVELGFMLIDDRKSQIISQIKGVIIELVHHKEGEVNMNLSDLLRQELKHEYNYLSNLFSEIEGTTIEKYFIAQKIEKVKELLVYDELSLSEIAYQLNYSSVAYLSNQFKKVTGLTPSHFKKVGENKRTPLDQV